MEEYDVIVVGSGSGMLIVNQSLAHGGKVALVDKGPRLGGTCLNYGCIPSKMLIHVADRIMEIEKVRELGVKVSVESVDFSAIMQRMRLSRDKDEGGVRHGIEHLEGLDFYMGEGNFVGDYTLQVNGKEIKGDRIFLASGSRPMVPPIKGLGMVDFLTNDTVLEMEEKPKSIIIVGGGYIGVEYAHFFSAMGTRVTIIEMADRLVLSEEPEIAELLLKELRKRMTVSLGTKLKEVKKDGEGVRVIAESAGEGKQSEFTAERIMLAIGRRSNADLLKVEKSGVDIDEKGFIKVNKYFETSKKNIFAIGDANGQNMFTHAANREALFAIDNVLHGEKNTLEGRTVPHAVYSYPQIASVGYTEEAAKKSRQIAVGMAHYNEVAKGEAMLEKEGFAKAIIDKKDGSILGFHIIGPYAPILIQEVVNAMMSGGNSSEINDGIHIHPSLTDLIPVALNSID